MHDDHEFNSDNGRTIKDVATLGGGCFWCLEAVYQQISGVSNVESGYSGGDVPDPSYEAVCAGQTGHAEVVQITYNTEIISYQNILRIFFGIHDPTTLNRQGADVGTQYRSVIFYHNNEQREKAGAFIRDMEASEIWDDPIVTEIVPFVAFYMAEDYHQNYFKNNPDQSYCRVVVAPKVAKFRKEFVSKLRS
ncbi:MAG: peptide-methionine (S)-S-oxide reductase MsrA [Anaerolineae bacterium]|nr:MAG: peptide-methionine (S)-S-oxide reductase MsrA [Anaerolineae bacterium]